MLIELVTRRGCHLCEEAEAELRGMGLQPVLRDVDADPALADVYDFRVPVVLADGRVVAEGKVDPVRLRTALDAGRSGDRQRPDLAVRGCGPEAAEDVHRLTGLAFAPHATLRPPSGALSETLEQVRDDLLRQGGAVASRGQDAIGCLRLDDAGDHLHVRRVAVHPDQQGHGVGRALMDWAEAEAWRRGRSEVRLGVRKALPGNLAFYQRLGYVVTGSHSHPGFTEVTWYSMAKRRG